MSPLRAVPFIIFSAILTVGCDKQDAEMHRLLVEQRQLSRDQEEELNRLREDVRLAKRKLEEGITISPEELQANFSTALDAVRRSFANSLDEYEITSWKPEEVSIEASPFFSNVSVTLLNKATKREEETIVRMVADKNGVWKVPSLEDLAPVESGIKNALQERETAQADPQPAPRAEPPGDPNVIRIRWPEDIEREHKAAAALQTSSNTSSRAPSQPSPAAADSPSPSRPTGPVVPAPFKSERPPIIIDFGD